MINGLRFFSECFAGNGHDVSSPFNRFCKFYCLHFVCFFYCFSSLLAGNSQFSHASSLSGNVGSKVHPILECRFRNSYILNSIYGFTNLARVEIVHLLSRCYSTKSGNFITIHKPVDVTLSAWFGGFFARFYEFFYEVVERCEIGFDCLSACAYSSAKYYH